MYLDEHGGTEGVQGAPEDVSKRFGLAVAASLKMKAIWIKFSNYPKLGSLHGTNVMPMPVNTWRPECSQRQ